MNSLFLFGEYSLINKSIKNSSKIFLDIFNKINVINFKYFSIIYSDKLLSETSLILSIPPFFFSSIRERFLESDFGNSFLDL